MSQPCNQCGKAQYHNLETDQEKEGVEIIHHSTASVIQINFYQDVNAGMHLPEIKKSEQWMDYRTFQDLYLELKNKAEGELSWLLK